MIKSDYYQVLKIRKNMLNINKEKWYIGCWAWWLIEAFAEGSMQLVWGRRGWVPCLRMDRLRVLQYKRFQGEFEERRQVVGPEVDSAITRIWEWLRGHFLSVKLGVVVGPCGFLSMLEPCSCKWRQMISKFPCSLSLHFIKW